MLEHKILKTEADYDAALVYVETLMDAEPDSPEEEELKAFALLIDTYEQVHYPINPPDPGSEENHLSWKDLRSTALARARALLEASDIDPCEVQFSMGLNALRDFVALEPEHWASLWYIHADIAQYHLFAKAWKEHKIFWEESTRIHALLDAAMEDETVDPEQVYAEINKHLDEFLPRFGIKLPEKS